MLTEKTRKKKPFCYHTTGLELACGQLRLSEETRTTGIFGIARAAGTKTNGSNECFTAFLIPRQKSKRKLTEQKAIKHHGG